MDVFIPDPGDTSKFYLFHATGDINYQPCPTLGGGYIPNKLYYSLIDKTLDNGHGAVISKNNIILNTLIGQSIIAIKHGNGRDWWIIIRHATQPAFIRWLITPAGISMPQYQFIGPTACAGFHSLKFSSSTNKVAGFKAYFDWPTTRYIDLYDFDRCSGLFSNSQTLTINHYFSSLISGGCEFSPSGRYLYAGVYDELHQFDMLAPNIQASETVVDSLDTLAWLYNKQTWGMMQLGPDGKIYANTNNSANIYLGVINYPDSQGIGCNAVHGGVTLPNGHYNDLPNIPLYELGPLAGSACDTLTTDIQSPPAPKGGEIKVFYQNDLQKAFINAQGIKGRKCKLRIFDTMGKVVYEFKGVTTPPYFTKDVDLNFLSNGLFIVNFETEKEVLSGKLVKE